MYKLLLCLSLVFVLLGFCGSNLEKSDQNEGSNPSINHESSESISDETKWIKDDSYHVLFSLQVNHFKYDLKIECDDPDEESDAFKQYEKNIEVLDESLKKIEDDIKMKMEKLNSQSIEQKKESMRKRMETNEPSEREILLQQRREARLIHMQGIGFKFFVFLKTGLLQDQMYHVILNGQSFTLSGKGVIEKIRPLLEDWIDLKIRSFELSIFKS